MSNYTKSTNFATKDNLTPGDPLKIVRGTEIDTEYNNIATAIATKTDNASAAITGGTINATTIGATTASTGAFSTLSATGAITSTLATGTAPLVIASTTKVANLNVDSLDGADWASPAALGSTTPAAVSATTLTTSSTVTFNGGTANGVAYLNGSNVVTSGSALVFDGTNLGLGVTPSAWGSGYKAFEFGNDSAKTGALFSNGTNDTWVVSNTYFNGSNFIYKTTGTATGYEQAAGQHRFYSAASGTAGNAITFTQAMTLDASGNLLAGTTTASNTPSQGITLMQNTSVGSIGIGHANGTSSGNGYLNFAYNGSAIGSITQDGTTAVLYNTTSDQRLKENITDADSASTLIDALQVRKFDWKAGGSHQRYGFVAQELVTVAPEAVHQPEDTEQMMAVDYSKLVPMLVKEIQSLRQRVAQLESN